MLGTQVRLGSREPWGGGGLPGGGPPRLPGADRLREPGGRPPPAPRDSARQRSARSSSAWGWRHMPTGGRASSRTATPSAWGLAKALLHNPRLLILDEPSLGLDPAGIVEIRQLLLELTRQQGVTVFMSSHILAEVARLAGRIGIIHQGRLLQELSSAELERNRRRRLVLRARDSRARRTRRWSPPGCPPRSCRMGALALADAGLHRAPGRDQQPAGPRRDAAHPPGGRGRGSGAVFPAPGGDGGGRAR